MLGEFKQTSKRDNNMCTWLTSNISNTVLLCVHLCVYDIHVFNCSLDSSIIKFTKLRFRAKYVPNDVRYIVTTILTDSGIWTRNISHAEESNLILGLTSFVSLHIRINCIVVVWFQRIHTICILLYINAAKKGILLKPPKRSLYQYNSHGVVFYMNIKYKNIKLYYYIMVLTIDLYILERIRLR